MKIAIVVNSSWAAYNFRLNLAVELERVGNEVFFIIPYDGNYSKKLQKKFQCFDLYLNAKSINPFKDLKTLFCLVKIYKQNIPDIICSFTIKPNIYSSIAAKLLHIPNICNITGLGTLFIEKRLTTFAAKYLYKLSLSSSSLVFFQNLSDRTFFLNNNLVKESRCKLIPGSGVDLERFRPIKSYSTKNKFVFLLIARILRDKGIYEFIESIRIIKKVLPEGLLEFHILGEVGVENKTAIPRHEIESWIKENLIKYLGVSDKVEKEIAKCDCVVLPSYREGMPRSILEAFAMGKPVIASNVPGCNDIVDHKVNGLLCKVQSAQDLADKMLSMSSMSSENRKKMGLNGKDKVEKFFDEKIVINEYVDSIKNIISNEKVI